MKTSKAAGRVNAGSQRQKRVVAVAKAFGGLRRKTRSKSFQQEWAEHKREELELEERKFRLCIRRPT